MDTKKCAGWDSRYGNQNIQFVLVQCLGTKSISHLIPKQWNFLTTTCVWFQRLSFIKAYEDKKARAALKVLKRISFRIVKFSAFKLISASNQSKFAVHLRWITRVYETSACKLKNIMFFENSCFFSRGATHPQNNLVRDLDQGNLPDQHCIYRRIRGELECLLVEQGMVVRKIVFCE